MKKIFITILFITIIYLGAGYNSFKSRVLIEKDQILEIKKGETYRSLGDKLGISNNFLKIYLKFNPPVNSLQAGSYKLKSGLNINGIINSLKKPITTDKIITILEGRNIYDIDKYLSDNGLIKNGDFIKINEEKLEQLKNDFGFIKKAITLEGFLYPDTYYVNPNNFTSISFTKTLLKNFENRVINDLDISVDSINLVDTVNLASILEKEERRVSEKPTVAGILKKRLNEKWFIGADATVCYPYKLTFDECTPKFIVNHIDDKNDYNTRTMIGLPKTPISNPSAETIESVINSKKTPYYFYLHDNNGRIHYATTNEEHVTNKQLYLNK